MIEVEGVDELVRLSRALKEAGAKDLQREMYAGINRAVKPLRNSIKQSARDNLPVRGGLANAVARSRVQTRRRTSDRGAGVRVVAKNRFSLYHLDRGEVRHRRANGGLTVQRIEPGWWTQPTDAVGDDVRRELVQALERVAAKLERLPRA